MKRSNTFPVLLSVVSFASIAVAVSARAGGREPESPDFQRDILPLLSDRCFRCHGPDAAARKAGLRLDDRSVATRKSRSGRAAIVAGEPGASELVRRIQAADKADRMPPPGSNLTLSAAERGRLIEWIAAGARYERHWAFQRLRAPVFPAVKNRAWVRNGIDRFVLAGLEKRGLEPRPQADPYRLIRRVSLDLCGLPPTPAEADAFADASTRRRGRDSAQPARPPARRDVNVHECDGHEDAYERLVERLLHSVAYGERMAWDWLELARYADSNGYQGDADRTMWPWRDWVVEALNRNMAYDEFSTWQLAGDLLPGGTSEQRLATGFCRNHMINGEGGRIPEENRVDYVMDMTETMGTVWLGLTLNCCRCHDHKYDPLLRKEYYQLTAFFNQTPVTGRGGDPQTAPAISVPSAEARRELEMLSRRIKVAAQRIAKREEQMMPAAPAAAPTAPDSRRAGGGGAGGGGGGGGGAGGGELRIPSALASILGKDVGKRKKDELEKLAKHWAKTAPEYTRELNLLRGFLERREQIRRSVPRVMVMEDMNAPRKTYMLEKGLYNKRGMEVQCGVPGCLPPMEDSTPRNRLGLARWLFGPASRLTARVTVNRIWQQFFGVGLVKSVEDFGRQADDPSHPDLLEWLAWKFRDSGWDLKELCRLIVTSATYRQASSAPVSSFASDPENRFLGRGARFRLPSWMLRDQALAVSGLLIERTGGSSVFPYQPPGVWADATFGKRRYRRDKGEGLYRRSLYTFWRRIIGPTMFFDTAARQTCQVRQSRTNTPLHALSTLNDTTYVEAARVLAADLALAAPGARPRELVRRAFRRVLIRPPGDEELAVLTAGFEAAWRDYQSRPEAAGQLLEVGDAPRPAGADAVGLAALATVCGSLLNLDETLTKE